MTKKTARFSNAVVTGASSGIGAAIARELLADGSRVAIVARRLDRLEAMAREHPPETGRGHPLPLAADVTDPASLALAAEKAREEMPEGLDLLVVSAGLAVFGPADALPTEQYRRMLETNTLGSIETIRAFLPDLRRRRGVLLVISSVAARIGSPGMAGYAASKFALRGFLHALRFELMKDGVAVVEVCPAQVDTEFFSHDAPKEKLPGGARILPMLRAEKVAPLALAAARRRVAHRTIPRWAGLFTWSADAMPGLARRVQRIIEGV